MCDWQEATSQSWCLADAPAVVFAPGEQSAQRRERQHDRKTGWRKQSGETHLIVQRVYVTKS